MPRVWNKRDPKCPKDAVYVGRPTKWGNPFSHLPSKVPGTVRLSDRFATIEAYAGYLESRYELKQAAKDELKGKDLVCWCAPLDCHADILLSVANE